MVRDPLMKTDGLVGEVGVPIEGTVLPDSYSFQRGDTRQSILDRMQRAMVKYLAAAWEKRQPTSVVTTPRDALDPRLDRREGNRQARASGARSPRSIPTGCGRACRCKPTRP